MDPKPQYTYTTRHPHGPHPAGSYTLIRESPSDWRFVEIQYPDGQTLELARAQWSFPGTPLQMRGTLDDEEAFRAIDWALEWAHKPST